MNKRKLIILCLLAVICCFLVTSAADEVVRSNAAHVLEGNTLVRLTIPGTYTVEIPAELPIQYSAEYTGMTLGVNSMNIGSKALQIAPESAGGELLQTGGSGRIPYTLLQGAALFEGIAFTAPGEEEINVNIAQDDWYNADAGNYTGAITFRVSMVDQQEGAQ